MYDEVYWVWLQQALGYFNENNNIIYSRGIDPKSLYGKDYDELNSYEIFSANQILKILEMPLSVAEKICEDCQRKNIKIYSVANEKYPNRLRNIQGLPLCLYVKGDTALFENIDELPLITVVGARNFSNYGRTVATAFATDLSAMGFVIVSGLAKGIDTFAHRGALSSNGKTIAVIGAGHDANYPKENAALRELIEENGVVITEYAPTVPPQSSHFPMRNRIMTGIAVGTLVVEAGERSGTLITAGHAISQGKDIFAVPNDIFDENGKGTIKLIKDGARVATSPKDIIDRYYWRYRPYMKPENAKKDYSINGSKDKDLVLKEQQEKKLMEEQKKRKTSSSNQSYSSKKEKPIEKKKKKEAPSYLTEKQRKLFDALSEEPKSVDELSLETKIETAELLSVITELEIYGLANSCPGQRYSY